MAGSHKYLTLSHCGRLSEEKTASSLPVVSQNNDYTWPEAKDNGARTGQPWSTDIKDPCETYLLGGNRVALGTATSTYLFAEQDWEIKNGTAAFVT